MTVLAGLSDLRELIDSTGPFVTIALPTPSELDDAQHRFETRWANARRALDDSRWTPEDLEELDALVADSRHDGGAALVVIRATDGSTLVEYLDEPVADVVVDEGLLPRLVPLIEARQRVIPHLVVEADRSGADIHAFDGGRVLGTDEVGGDTQHIHRGHPGGWSQRRFQQRAENTWERNADEVASQIVDLAEQTSSASIFLAGDVRATHLVVEALPESERNISQILEAGSPDGIADEVVRLLSDQVARRIRELGEQVREQRGAGMASTDMHDVLDALEAGRVAHLLVHDDGTDEPFLSDPLAGVPKGARVADAAVAAALRTDAEITAVPGLALLDGPIAALYRW